MTILSTQFRRRLLVAKQGPILSGGLKTDHQFTQFVGVGLQKPPPVGTVFSQGSKKGTSQRATEGTGTPQPVIFPC